MIHNGVSNYRIVVGKDAIASEQTAAKTLQDYLARISGVTLPIVTDETAAREEEIIVGKTTREGGAFTVDRAALGWDGIVMKAVGRTLVLAGGQPRGTLYAVYSFLEERLGCRWFTKDLTVVPEQREIAFPTGLDVTYVPPFEYRETDWLSPHDVAYSVANKLNGLTYRPLDESVGGGIAYTGGLAHTFTAAFVNKEKYFADHPEWYALREGERVATQLCLTNPEVLQKVIEEVQAILDNDPTVTLISLTQADNDKPCQCEHCRAFNAEQESEQGTNLAFVNAVADHFREKYPDLKFDTFAYWYTRKPPKTLKPASNVVVRLCSIECCFGHPFDDPDCPKNTAFCADIRKWSEIAEKLYIWDYTTCYRNYITFFPNFHVLQPNMRFLRDHNVIGVYDEGNYTAADGNGEFAELRAYLLAKLLWDPDTDVERHRREFCASYYGAAAQQIIEFLDIICYRASHHVSTRPETFGERTHFRIYYNPDEESMQCMTVGDVAYIDKLWKTAKENAQTEEILRHVQLSEFCWRYWKCCNRVAEFAAHLPEEQYLQAAQKLYDDLIAFDVVQIREARRNGRLSTHPKLNEPPYHWTIKFSGE